MESFNFVSDLRPFKTNWKLRVKILKVWSRGSPSRNWHDMLVCDVKGFRIQASVRQTHVHVYEDILKENEWRIFCLFGVSDQKMFGPRADDHLKIDFLPHTSVLIIRPVSASLCLHPIRFFDIIDRAIHRDHLIDVIGVVHDVGELKKTTFPWSGFIDYNLRFELINAERDNVLDCNTSGKMATKFHDRYTSMKDGVIICVLRFWRISDGKGDDKHSVVLNSLDISDFMFNPINEDVEEFQSKFLMKCSTAKRSV